jgi:hypothetical protein
MRKMSATLLVGLMLALAASGNAQEAVERMTTQQVHAHLIQVQSAYHERDAASYRFGVQELLDDARGASPSELHARLREVVAVGIRSGFDGLEPLVAALGDGLAKDASGVAPAELSLTLASLDRNLRFTRPVAPNLRMPLGRLDSQVVRSVRGEALRTLVEALGESTLRIGTVQIDDALADPAIQVDLCALELRIDETGEIAEQEREREARCQAIQAQLTPQQPDTGLLDAFADLACLAEKDGTAEAGELEKLFQQCVADSQGDGRPSAGLGDVNGDGCIGFCDKLYPSKLESELYRRCFDGGGGWCFAFSTGPIDTTGGDNSKALFDAVMETTERESDEAAIVAWEAAEYDAVILEQAAENAAAEAQQAREAALAAAVDPNVSDEEFEKYQEEAAAARERADQAKRDAEEARREADEARAAMEQRKSMPPEEGRVNLDSEACQDVLSLLSAGKFDYDVLTGTIRPPAYENPNPEADPAADGSAFCGLSSDGVPTSGGGCEEQVLCPEGMALNESCGCDDDAVSAMEQAKIAGYCAFEFVCDGEIVVENGLCSCETPEDAVDASGPMPPPPPDPAEGTSDITMASQTSLPPTPVATTTVQSASSTTTSTSTVISPTTTMTSSPLRTMNWR